MSTGSVGRNDDLRACRLEPLAEVVGVIGLVRQQAAWWRHIVEQRGRDADIGDISRRQDKGDRLAFSVGQSVDLAGPSTT